MRSRIGNTTWRSFFFGLAILVAVLGGEICTTWSEVVTDEMFSPSLAGNLLNDPANRPMRIYLPPGYDVGDTRYPVVYYLHGYRGIEDSWLNRDIQDTMDELISQGKIQEMVLVMPNAHNSYEGSWYANSSVAGNYEDYITRELAEFIDGKYRTLPQRESRAIAGGSMGGFGAMKLAIKHPDVYCAVVSHSGVLSFNQWKNIMSFVVNNRIFQAMAIAFSPNPDAALLYDFPVDNAGNLLEDVWQRWLEHDPLTLAEIHQDELRQLSGIYFDHGTLDSTVNVQQARNFDRTLTEAGIPHIYEEYVGEHADKWPSRLLITLPFLSEHLSSEIITPVNARGKLATTWGKMKLQ
jgi:S-formylglutathione hydrolase